MQATRPRPAINTRPVGARHPTTPELHDATFVNDGLEKKEVIFKITLYEKNNRWENRETFKTIYSELGRRLPRLLFSAH